MTCYVVKRLLFERNIWMPEFFIFTPNSLAELLPISNVVMILKHTDKTCRLSIRSKPPPPRGEKPLPPPRSSTTRLSTTTSSPRGPPPAVPAKPKLAHTASVNLPLGETVTSKL